MSDGTRAGNAVQCMFAAEALRGEMEAMGEVTVGGLYQIAHLSHRGLQSIPYFYRARVAPGYSTYVAMRLENGLWVQHHRPSNTVRHVLPLFADELIRHSEVIAGAHEMFEPSLFLSPTSPGVIPDEQLVLAYLEYDPSHVPPQVIASWGSAPIPPATFA